MSVDIEEVSGTLERLLQEGGRPVLMKGVIIAPDVCAAPDGLLGLFLIAGEALWCEAKGEGFAIKTEPDDGALLGYKVTQINGASFTSVMLATMEAAAQAAGPHQIVVEELDGVWRRSRERFEAWRNAGDESL